MKFTHLLLVLLLASTLATVSAQQIEPIELGNSILLNFSAPDAISGFTFTNPAETTYTLDVTYLGEPFTLRAEWYDENGALLWMVLLSANGSSQALLLPTGDLTLLVSTVASATGRATLTLNPAGEPVNQSANQPAALLSLPNSGNWVLNLLDIENNCPNDLLAEEMWMPADGSVHALRFSSIDKLPLELHRLVAAQEITETPEAFNIRPGSDPLQFEVIPHIQTGLEPFVYHYLVLDENTIRLDYVQTMALSDCVLTAYYEIAFGAAGNVLASADLSQWGTFGDANAPTSMDDNPAAICASDLSQGETWYFVADESFVAALTYGATLRYDLRLMNTGSLFVDYDLEMVIGNGFVLRYDFDYAPSAEWTPFAVELREGAGWYDPDGAMPTDDADLFRQMLSDATALLIRGEYINGSDTACLVDVRLETDAPAASRLQNGRYSAVLVSATPNCDYPPIGTTTIEDFVFEFAADDSLLTVQTQDAAEGIPFRQTAPNVYLDTLEGSATLSIISPTQFTTTNTHEGNCTSFFEATLVE